MEFLCLKNKSNAHLEHAIDKNHPSNIELYDMISKP